MLKAKGIAELIVHKTLVRGEKPEVVLEQIETYLTKKSRTDIMPLVARYVRIMLSYHRAGDTIHIKSAHKLSDELQKSISARLSSDNVEHAVTVDPAMLGGFEAEYKGHKIGMNVAKNIDRLATHIKN